MKGGEFHGHLTCYWLLKMDSAPLSYINDGGGTSCPLSPVFIAEVPSLRARYSPDLSS